MPRTASPFGGYWIGVGAFAVAFAGTLALGARGGPIVTPLFLAAVAASAFYGGVGPAVICTALSSIAIEYFLLAPLDSFNFAPGDVVGHFLVLLAALLIIAMAVARRRAERQRETLLAREQAARGDLERALARAEAAGVAENAARQQAEDARREAEEANHAKDEFLAMLSHELRTPLNAIVSWTSLLRGGRLDETQAARALDAVDRNGRLQVRLIEDLLDVSRIAAGKLSVERRPLALAGVVEGVSEAMRGVAEAKRQELVVETEEPAAIVEGDVHRLQQVFNNLLVNAIKFTPEGGRIHVAQRCVGPYVEVTVRDTGEGIPLDLLPHVFERFRQADGASVQRQGGLGLGLAIARYVVERHGGTLAAESAGPGLGSTFRLRLPKTEPVGDEAEQLAPREPATLPALRGVRVLLVDEESEARDLLCAVLAECGAHVTATSGVRDALRQFEATRPDVLVTDLAMPEEDGYALIRKVRGGQGRAGKRLPAIAFTAHAGAETRQQVIAAGFDLHLRKPMDPADVVAAIAALLATTGDVAAPGPA